MAAAGLPIPSVGDVPPIGELYKAMSAAVQVYLGDESVVPAMELQAVADRWARAYVSLDASGPVQSGTAFLRRDGDGWAVADMAPFFDSARLRQLAVPACLDTDRAIRLSAGAMEWPISSHFAVFVGMHYALLYPIDAVCCIEGQERLTIVGPMRLPEHLKVDAIRVPDYLIAAAAFPNPKRLDAQTFVQESLAAAPSPSDDGTPDPTTMKTLLAGSINAVSIVIDRPDDTVRAAYIPARERMICVVYEISGENTPPQNEAIGPEIIASVRQLVQSETENGAKR